MDDGGIKGPKTEFVYENYNPKPLSIGIQQDNGPHQKSILVAWYVEHNGRLCAIMFSMSTDKTRPQ